MNWAQVMEFMENEENRHANGYTLMVSVVHESKAHLLQKLADEQQISLVFCHKKIYAEDIICAYTTWETSYSIVVELRKICNSIKGLNFTCTKPSKSSTLAREIVNLFEE